MVDISVWDKYAVGDVKQQIDKAPTQVTYVTAAEVWPDSTPVNQNLAWLCKQGIPNDF